jgi:hypothetical protein
VLGALGTKVIRADGEQYTIVAATSANWQSFGLTVKVMVQARDGGSLVRVEAAPSASLYDWGSSKAFLQRFRENWA